MTHSERGQGKRAIDTYLYVAVAVSVLLCLTFLVGYLAVSKREFTVDVIVLVLLFGGIGISFLPCLSRLKIGGLLEMERLGEKVREVEGILLRGEVVRDGYDTLSYIDTAGRRHLIPDDPTARFLASSKGVIPVAARDLEPYPLTDPKEMDSVLEGRLRQSGPHIFILLNGKRYWVGMDYLLDWGRQHERDWEPITEEELRRYARGRS